MVVKPIKVIFDIIKQINNIQKSPDFPEEYEIITGVDHVKNTIYFGVSPRNEGLVDMSTARIKGELYLDDADLSDPSKLVQSAENMIFKFLNPKIPASSFH